MYSSLAIFYYIPYNHLSFYDFQMNFASTIRLNLILQPCDAHNTTDLRHWLQLFVVHETTDAVAVQLFDVPSIGREFSRPFQIDQPIEEIRAIAVRWFSDVLDHTKGDLVVSQQLMGCGGMIANGDTKIALYDETNTIQGHLSIGGLKLTNSNSSTPDMTVARDLIDSNRKAQIASRKVYLGVELGWKKMPLEWFVFCAKKMEHVADSTDAANEAIRFFDAMLVAARAVAGQGVSDYQLLAEFLSFPSHRWIYKVDQTRSGLQSDCWSSIFSWPDPSIAAFDCEDGSRALLELFFVFCKLRLNRSSSLFAMQALARQYSPYLAIGELREETENDKEFSYCLHCFVVLVPLPGVKVPCITLESTSYCSSACVPSTLSVSSAIDIYNRGLKKIEDWAGQKTKLLDIPTSRTPAQLKLLTERNEAITIRNKEIEQLNSIARLRQPYDLLKRDRFYGKLSSLIGFNNSNWCYEHRVATHNTMVFDFLESPNQFMPDLVNKSTLPLIKSAFHTHWLWSPCSRFPTPPHSQSQSQSSSLAAVQNIQSIIIPRPSLPAVKNLVPWYVTPQIEISILNV